MVLKILIYVLCNTGGISNTVSTTVIATSEIPKKKKKK